MTAMSPALRRALVVTDGLFLLYWSLSALDLAGIVPLPRDWLFADHDVPMVVAWNWSFMPLDLAFSITGLLAVSLAARGRRAWIGWALISLTLTSTAGLMAIAYWTILGQFDPAWFLPNLAICLWPFAFFGRLLRQL